MSDELRKQIYNNLKLKDIYELLEIWRVNNRVIWSDTTFEVLREILREKFGKVPPQDEAVLESTEDSEENDDGLEEWEVNLLDKENQPDVRMLFQGIVLHPSEIAKALPDMLITIFSVGFRIAVTIIPLKALSQILRIRMEMEFRSQKTN